MISRTLTKVFGGGDRHASQSGNEVEEIECDPQPPRKQQVEPGQWPELLQADVVAVVDPVSLAVPSGASIIDFELPHGSTMLAAYDKRSLEAMVLKTNSDLSVACGGPNCNEDSGWLVAGFDSTGIGGTYGS